MFWLNDFIGSPSAWEETNFRMRHDPGATKAPGPVEWDARYLDGLLTHRAILARVLNQARRLPRSAWRALRMEIIYFVGFGTSIFARNPTPTRRPPGCWRI